MWRKVALVRATGGGIVHSYADHLPPFLPCIPPNLVSEMCLQDVIDIAQRLPAALGTSPFFLECPLDDRDSADFGVGITADHRDRHPLTGLGPGVDRFMESWADPASLLNRVVEEVWLEFDIGSPSAGHSPSVFFGSPRPAATAGARQADEEQRAAQEGLALLTGRPAPPVLAECLSGVPDLARIQFLGAMLSRDTDAVRMIVSSRRVEALVGRLQHRGLRDPRRLPVGDIARLVHHVWLAVDVDGGGFGPVVGLECYLDDTTPWQDGGRWTALLDHLVEQGACTDAKREALLGLTGLPGEGGWPAGLRNIATVLGPAGLGVMRLFLHHVKVTERPDAPLEAKAYLRGGYA
jgi:hypothetical protein